MRHWVVLVELGKRVEDQFMDRRAVTKSLPWHLFVGAIAVLLPLCFPPWCLSFGDTKLRLGVGTPFGPTIESVTETSPACNEDLQVAHARYAQTKAAWAQYPRDEGKYQEEMRARAVTIRELVRKGLDPSKVTSDGRKIQFRNGMPQEPSAESESLPPSEPTISMLEAESGVAAAQTKCDGQSRDRRGEARIDFGMLAYNLAMAMMLVSIGIAIVYHFNRRMRKAQ
jgi:hypothetical protein